MPQTVNDPQGSAERRTRPGQRQQERLQRLARRRKRRLTIIASIVALVGILIVCFVLWEYQQYTTRQQAAATALSNKNATSTARGKATANAVVTATSVAKANISGTATAQVQTTAVAKGVKALGTLPKSGPNSPPALSSSLKTVTTSTGLKYIDIKQGTGPASQNGNTVYVEYTGWVQSTGKKFDSSYDHGGQPFGPTLGKNQVIPGFEEGLQGLKVGGSRRLIIPPNLAYANQPPQGSNIPSNATLIFDVTVVTIL